MLLSYNLIKNTSEIKQSNKVIETNYIAKVESEGLKTGKDKLAIEDEIKKSYEMLGSNIIKKSKSEAEEIVMKARVLSAEIEKKAYEEGYIQGKANGFEDGYNEGLKKINRDTEEEVREKIEKAEEILQKANKEYNEYLSEKEKEIINLAFEMASIIAKKELEVENGILPLIEDVLEEAKGEENIIIKCNSIHINAIEDKINYYKKAYAIKGDVFILENPIMEAGNAVIEKSTGKAVVGLDIGLEKLKAALCK